MERILFSAVECLGDYCEPFDGDVAPIYVINSDGSGFRKIYEGTGLISGLQLSPDGSRLAFRDNYGRGISNAYVYDFADNRSWPLLADDADQSVSAVIWFTSEQLAVIRTDGMNSSEIGSDLYTVDVNGTQIQKLTDFPPRTLTYSVSASPDRSSLLFSTFELDTNVTTIYRINTDGTGLTELATLVDVGRVNVIWPPFGDSIVFHSTLVIGAIPASIYTINLDDNEIQKLATFPVRLLNFLGWAEDSLDMIFYICDSPTEINEIVNLSHDGDLHTQVTIEIPETPSDALICVGGVLSFDQQRFALSTAISYPENRSLYVLDMYNGYSYRILSGFRVQSLVWLPEDVALPSTVQ